MEFRFILVVDVELEKKICFNFRITFSVLLCLCVVFLLSYAALNLNAIPFKDF